MELVVDCFSCCSFTWLRAVFVTFAISVQIAVYPGWAVIGFELRPRLAHSVTNTVPICCYSDVGFCSVGVCWADAAGNRGAHPFASLTLRLCYD